MGIQGTVLYWFKSYLDGRHQSVQVSSTHLTVGIPQGSHIVPHGFTQYIDDILETTQKHGVYAQLYADDTQLYLPFSFNDYSSKEAVCIIEDCISGVKNGCIKRS